MCAKLTPTTHTPTLLTHINTGTHTYKPTPRLLRVPSTMCTLTSLVAHAPHTHTHTHTRTPHSECVLCLSHMPTTHAWTDRPHASPEMAETRVWLTWLARRCMSVSRGCHLASFFLVGFLDTSGGGALGGGQPQVAHSCCLFPEGFTFVLLSLP